MRQELTLSSGESSADVDTESEDMAEGGLAGAERSERDVEALVGQHYKHSEKIVCGSYVLDHRKVSNTLKRMQKNSANMIESSRNNGTFWQRLCLLFTFEYYD